MFSFGLRCSSTLTKDKIVNLKFFLLLATRSSPPSYPRMAFLWSTPSTRMDIAMSSQRRTRRYRVPPTMMTSGLANLSRLICTGLLLGLKCFLLPKTEVSERLKWSDGYCYILTETDPPVQSAAYDDDFWIGKPIPPHLYRAVVGTEVLLAPQDRGKWEAMERWVSWLFPHWNWPTGAECSVRWWLWIGKPIPAHLYRAVVGTEVLFAPQDRGKRLRYKVHQSRFTLENFLDFKSNFFVLNYFLQLQPWRYQTTG